MNQRVPGGNSAGIRAGVLCAAAVAVGVMAVRGHSLVACADGAAGALTYAWAAVNYMVGIIVLVGCGPSGDCKCKNVQYSTFFRMNEQYTGWAKSNHSFGKCYSFLKRRPISIQIRHLSS